MIIIWGFLGFYLQKAQQAFVIHWVDDKSAFTQRFPVRAQVKMHCRKWNCRPFPGLTFKLCSVKHRSEPVTSYQVPHLRQPYTVTTFGSRWDKSCGVHQRRNREPKCIQDLTACRNDVDRLPTGFYAGSYWHKDRNIKKEGFSAAWVI